MSGAFFDWVWQHIVGPALNGVFMAIPAPVWIVVAGLLVGWAFKTFGWQGVLGAGVAVLTLGAYRKGWRDRSSLEPTLPSVVIKPAAQAKPPQAKPPQAKPTRRYNPDTNRFE